MSIASISTRCLRHTYCKHDLTFECFCKVTDWIIKPSTMPFSCRCVDQDFKSLKSVIFLQLPCSFVELLCEKGIQEARPTWFCSHWQVHLVTWLGMRPRLAGGANRSFRSLRQLKLMPLFVTWATSQLFGSVRVSSHLAFNRKLTDRFDFVLRR